MSVNETSTDFMPEEFDSYEALSNFWDNHDTTHYPEAFEEVALGDIELKNRRFEVEMKADLMTVLSEKAQRQGVAVKQLVDSLLREALDRAA